MKNVLITEPWQNFATNQPHNKQQNKS